MKTSHRSAARAARAGLFVAALVSGFGLSYAAAPAATVDTKPAASKTHVLFMGADIALEKGKEFFRVEDVTESTLLIKPEGKTVGVPLTPNVNLRISESLKIAPASIGVENLKFERAYTPGADPYQQLNKSAALAGGQSAVADLAQGEVLRANAGVGASSGVYEAMKGTPNEAMGRAALQESVDRQTQAEAARTEIYNSPNIQAYDVGAQSAEAGVRASREMFDAIRLSFELTSPKDLSQPYYAVVAQIRERDSKPGQVRKWAYVKSLGSMSAGETKKVSVYRGGLPPGYILEGCEVHLYNHGEELATSLSRKRVALTDDEALDYRIIEYIGANKGRTLPSTILDGGVRAQLTTAQLSETHYVRVAKDGRVAAAFRDAAGKQPIGEPALESTLKGFRFKPALEAGKPVESIAPIKLGQFASP